jgi:hypothetical protein
MYVEQFTISRPPKAQRPSLLYCGAYLERTPGCLQVVVRCGMHAAVK